MAENVMNARSYHGLTSHRPCRVRLGGAAVDSLGTASAAVVMAIPENTTSWQPPHAARRARARPYTASSAAIALWRSKPGGGVAVAPAQARSAAASASTAPHSTRDAPPGCHSATPPLRQAASRRAQRQRLQARDAERLLPARGQDDRRRAAVDRGHAGVLDPAEHLRARRTRPVAQRS